MQRFPGESSRCIPGWNYPNNVHEIVFESYLPKTIHRAGVTGRGEIHNLFRFNPQTSFACPMLHWLSPGFPATFRANISSGELVPFRQ
jgi:hypothetical protein